MAEGHEELRDLVAALAVGAALPGDASRVGDHLAECAQCAADSARLRETVRLMAGAGGGPRGNGAPRGNGGPYGNGPYGSGPYGNGASGRAPMARDAVVRAALRTRGGAPAVAAHAAPYAAAVAGLDALLRELDDLGAWGTPVANGWDAHGTVAHLIAADEPLAVRLGHPARIPPVDVPLGGGWREAWAARTAAALAHEGPRTPAETRASWYAQTRALLTDPAAYDAELAARATELMGVRLPVADHFLIRAFETWVHTDDIGRAIGRTVPPPPDPQLRRLVGLAVRILNMALGQDAAPVLLTVEWSDGTAQEWVLGSEEEPVAAQLVLHPVDFCLLIGGRYPVAEVPRGTSGDPGAAQHALERAAALAWL
ncbi:maleylpyruvate isomerase N-terminal domain-containing protein [Streptomyces sp. NPDC050504]|uniref:maleylpyruvate isomerase N-terminal domain-containing protein n=1 Tax=Streptomyces sp. NPDC050504 TaxID=3365618 RepID=UPI00379F6102